MTHHPHNPDRLPRELSEVLGKTWEYWPEEVRREAERRETYVRMVDAIRGEYRTLMEAYEAAAAAVFDAHRARWELEDAEFAARRAAEEQRSRRSATGSAMRAVKPLVQPNPYTLRGWHGVWSRHGRDIRLLIPLYHLRGSRAPRHPREEGDKVDTYKLMRRAIEAWYLGMTRRRKNYAYGKYLDLCRGEGVAPVSDRTFRVFSRFMGQPGARTATSGTKDIPPELRSACRM